MALKTKNVALKNYLIINNINDYFKIFSTINGTINGIISGIIKVIFIFS